MQEQVGDEVAGLAICRHVTSQPPRPPAPCVQAMALTHQLQQVTAEAKRQRARAEAAEVELQRRAAATGDGGGDTLDAVVAASAAASSPPPAGKRASGMGGGSHGGHTGTFNGALLSNTDPEGVPHGWESLPPGERERVAELIEPPSHIVLASGGRGRFYLSQRVSGGYVNVRGERASAKALVARLRLNPYLEKAQRSHPGPCRDALLVKMCHVLGLALVEGEMREAADAVAAAARAQAAEATAQADAAARRLYAVQAPRVQLLRTVVAAVLSQAWLQAALATSVSSMVRIKMDTDRVAAHSTVGAPLVVDGEGGTTSGPVAHAPLATTPPRTDAVDRAAGAVAAAMHAGGGSPFAVGLWHVGAGLARASEVLSALRRPANTVLSLSGCALRDEEIAPVVEHLLAAGTPLPPSLSMPYVPVPLPGLAVLAELQLADNELTQAAIPSLAACLSHSAVGLRVVDLRRNRLVAPAAASALARALELNPSMSFVVRGREGEVVEAHRTNSASAPFSLATAPAVAAPTSSGAISPATGGLGPMAASLLSTQLRIDLRDQRPPPDVPPPDTSSHAGPGTTAPDVMDSGGDVIVKPLDLSLLRSPDRERSVSPRKPAWNPDTGAVAGGGGKRRGLFSDVKPLKTPSPRVGRKTEAAGLTGSAGAGHARFGAPAGLGEVTSPPAAASPAVQSPAARAAHLQRAAAAVITHFTGSWRPG